MTKKRVLCIALALAVIMSIAAISYAAETRAVSAFSYEFNFRIPYPTQLQVSSAAATSGTFNAWASTVPTTVRTRFWISTNAYDPVGSKITDGVDFTSPATKSFTYYTGHGGAGYAYRLCAGCPLGTPYSTYDTYGTWSAG